MLYSVSLQNMSLMKEKIAVLGAGMVGRAMAIDLSLKYKVTSIDINENNLAFLNAHSAIECIQADLSLYNNYKELLKDFNTVVNAVPGFMGFKTLQTLIELNKNVADISFFPENALDLDALAKQHNVTAIVDCGVAPGMSNLLLGYYDTQMEIQSFDCMVGGLPKHRSKPFEYKAPFSPIDVVEEYIRPARYKENGHIVIKPALSDAELIEFDHIGTLEAFNTDGLRSILFTMQHIPDMKEKTLRYPGHISLIQSLKKAGFFDTVPVNIKGSTIRPIDLTTALLFKEWKLEEDEPEYTVMRIVIKGTKAGVPTTVEYMLYDENDLTTKTSSMARTTGYTCTAALNLITEKKFTTKGIFPPELIGKEKDCFEFMMAYLAERNVKYISREIAD
jgi:saccharopine dehydrogenase-like NADP-dependent oxidoreductase